MARRGSEKTQYKAKASQKARVVIDKRVKACYSLVVAISSIQKQCHD
jgi:uncharacterized protein involved in tolerance to divalent cations